MELKINKKYCCKKSLILSPYKPIAEIIYGVYYEIVSIVDNSVFINLGKSYHTMNISNNKIKLCRYDFCDYFYTKKEERAIKLNKLLYDNV